MTSQEWRFGSSPEPRRAAPQEAAGGIQETAGDDVVGRRDPHVSSDPVVGPVELGARPGKPELIPPLRPHSVRHAKAHRVVDDAASTQAMSLEDEHRVPQGDLQAGVLVVAEQRLDLVPRDGAPLAARADRGLALGHVVAGLDHRDVQAVISTSRRVMTAPPDPEPMTTTSKT